MFNQLTPLVLRAYLCFIKVIDYTLMETSSLCNCLSQDLTIIFFNCFYVVLRFGSSFYSSALSRQVRLNALLSHYLESVSCQPDTDTFLPLITTLFLHVSSALYSLHFHCLLGSCSLYL